MVHGRAGMRLEALKFGLYITIPLVATTMFNDPDTIQKCVDYYKFIEYPPEDPETTRMKKDLEDLKKNIQERNRKKMIMQRQLQSLDDLVENQSATSDERSGGGWWRVGRWFGRGQPEEERS